VTSSIDPGRAAEEKSLSSRVRLVSLRHDPLGGTTDWQAQGASGPTGVPRPLERPVTATPRTGCCGLVLSAIAIGKRERVRPAKMLTGIVRRIAVEYSSPGPDRRRYVGRPVRASPGVGEAGPAYEFNREAPNLEPRVSQILARLGLTPAAGSVPGSFLSPPGIAVDSRADIYVGDLELTSWRARFPPVPMLQR